MEARIPFLGMGWGFPPSFVKAARTVEMTADEQDVFKSLEILLSTSLGERVMQPTYGCDLRRMLFEPLDASLTAYIKDLLRTAILYHEARIRLEQISLRDLHEEGKLEITLDFTIRNTNSRYNLVLPFYRNEGVGRA